MCNIYFICIIYPISMKGLLFSIIFLSPLQYQVYIQTPCNLFYPLHVYEKIHALICILHCSGLSDMKSSRKQAESNVSLHNLNRLTILTLLIIGLQTPIPESLVASRVACIIIMVWNQSKATDWKNDLQPRQRSKVQIGVSPKWQSIQCHKPKDEDWRGMKIKGLLNCISE